MIVELMKHNDTITSLQISCDSNYLLSELSIIDCVFGILDHLSLIHNNIIVIIYLYQFIFILT